MQFKFVINFSLPYCNTSCAQYPICKFAVLLQPYEPLPFCHCFHRATIENNCNFVIILLMQVPPTGGCPLCLNGLDRFNYRSVLLLRQFLTPDGYLIGRRKTGIRIYSLFRFRSCKCLLSWSSALSIPWFLDVVMLIIVFKEAVLNRVFICLAYR